MKIIGNVVGMGLPKPNLKQTDPKKGDYVKGKDEIPAKVSQLENDSEFVKAPELTDAVGNVIDPVINEALTRAKESGEFKPVKGVDYWTDEDKAEIAAGITVLTDGEIEMLNALLMEGSLTCEPVIEASVAKRSIPYTNPITGSVMGYDYYWDITATITGIDKRLVQKVEVGRIRKSQAAYDDITYGNKMTVTLSDDKVHTAVYTYDDGSYYGTYYFGVRLTYYTLFGDTATLVKEIQ